MNEPRTEGRTPATQLEEPQENPAPKSRNSKPARRSGRNRIATASAWVLVAIVLLVLVWPLTLKLASHAGPTAARFAQQHQPDQLSEAQFQPPGVTHWFGTDVH